jgi:hypothetical protein
LTLHSESGCFGEYKALWLSNATQN